MDEDVEDEVQNDKEIEKVGKEIGNAAGNTLKKAVNKIKSGLKKAWEAIPLKAKLIIIGVIIVLLVLLMVIIILEKYFADNKVAGTSVDKNIGDCVTIVKAPNEEDGYYFKIDKDILNYFKDAFNEAYANGEYEASLDSLLYGEGEDDEEEIDDEEIESFLESYDYEDEDDEYEDDGEDYKADGDDKEFDEKEIAQLFGTDDINQARAYFAKMIKAHVASSYPKLGYYEGEEANSEIDKRLGNRFDIDGDYAAQGIIKVKRTTMAKMETRANIISSDVGENVELIKVEDPNGNGMDYYEVKPKEMKDGLPLIIFLHGDNRFYKYQFFGSLDARYIENAKYVISGQAYKECGEFIYIAPRGEEGPNRIRMGCI